MCNGTTKYHIQQYYQRKIVRDQFGFLEFEFLNYLNFDI